MVCAPREAASTALCGGVDVAALQRIRKKTLNDDGGQKVIENRKKMENRGTMSGMLKRRKEINMGVKRTDHLPLCSLDRQGLTAP